MRTPEQKKETRLNYYQRLKDEKRCVSCKTAPVIDTVTCAQCVARIKHNKDLLKAQRRRKGLCGCGRKREDKTFRLCLTCRTTHVQKRIELKRIVFEHYGNCCACCGEKYQGFLQLDHVNDDGANERNKRKAKHRSGFTALFYAQIIRDNFPGTFQILCANCNFGKRVGNGVCPHQTDEYFTGRKK